MQVRLRVCRVSPQLCFRMQNRMAICRALYMAAQSRLFVAAIIVFTSYIARVRGVRFCVLVPVWSIGVAR